VKVLALVACLAFLLVPFAAASVGTAVPPASTAACAGPPCGYITPIVDVDVASKPKCPGSPGSVDLSKCIPLPAKGQSVSFDAVFHYGWKISEDLTYPPGQDPVVVTFSGVSTNPKWMTMKVDPATITIDAVALMNPQNMCPDTTNPTAPVSYCFTQPVKITFTHAEDPDAAAIQKVVAKAGLVEMFVKAKSSASGQYFKEGFGVESFRFDARSVLPPPATSHSSPANGLLAPLAAFAVALLVRRRSTT